MNGAPGESWRLDKLSEPGRRTRPTITDEGADDRPICRGSRGTQSLPAGHTLSLKAGLSLGSSGGEVKKRTGCVYLLISDRLDPKLVRVEGRTITR
jgi:hypothetical protein